MRIGIVNPYSWDVPGGVGFHIRDLALKLRSRGHDVRVLSPSSSRASGQGLPLRMELQFGRTERLRSSSRAASPYTSAAPVTVYPP